MRVFPVLLCLLSLALATGCVSERESSKKELEAKGYRLDEISMLRAIQNLDVDATNLFIKAGMSKIDGEPILITAIQQNQRRIVGVMVEAGADVNARGVKGLTPLMMAAGNGRAEMTQLLILSGANLNATDDAGNTALMWAATRQDTTTLKILLDAGAGINLRNKAKQTALEMGGSQEVKDLLAATGGTK